MTTDIWILRALTNLHAGSGDADFGIVDKHVQRDPVTGMPTIFASSIKGALRQVFDLYSKGNTENIFGSDNRGNSNKSLKQGTYTFHNAKLLALPVRSTQNFYYLATCPEILEEMAEDLSRYLGDKADNVCNKLKSLAGTGQNGPVYLGTLVSGLQLEDIRPQAAAWPENLSKADATIKMLFGSTGRLAVVPGEKFAELVSALPTIARNHLDNGISTNLWYEEIVPRESRFYLPISRTVSSDEIEPGLLKAEIKSIVQIGGNATVGYGQCEWTKLETI